MADEEATRQAWFDRYVARTEQPGRLRGPAFEGGLLAGLGVRAETMKKEWNTTS